MAKGFSIDEVIAIAKELKLSRGDAVRDIIEEQVTLLGRLIAEKLEVECGDAVYDAPDFGGTLIFFYPSAPGQPLPEVFEHYDVDADWNEESNDENV